MAVGRTLSAGAPTGGYSRDAGGAPAGPAMRASHVTTHPPNRTGPPGRRARSAAPSASRAAALVLALLGPAALALPPLADETVRIASPDARTVVYGSTEVVVDGPADLSYRVYRRVRPGERGDLICNVPGPPRAGACIFDAGEDLASERLVVEAVDRAGRLAGRDEVETYFFQRPSVSVSRPPNPLVEIGVSGDEDAVRRVLDDPALIDCTLSGAPCRVASIRRTRDAGILRVTLLVDESNSIGAAGLERLRPAIRTFVGMIEVASGGALAVEYDVRFFAEAVRSATSGFTGDVDEVEEALATGQISGGTCLYGALSRVLRDLSFWRAKDRWTRRAASDALIVWSDGQDACPATADPGSMFAAPSRDEADVLATPGQSVQGSVRLEGDDEGISSRQVATAGIRGRGVVSPIDEFAAAAAIEDARWADVPVYVVPIELVPPCPTGSCTPDPIFLEFGPVSGGVTYDAGRALPELLTEEIFDDLMSRYVAEIEPASVDLLERPGPLTLAAGEGVTLRHREIVGERRTRRETALAILRARTADIEAKAAAADLLAKSAEPVTADEAELIYRELARFIRGLGRDLEAQAREDGRRELARYLRARRRSSGSKLTHRELAIVRLLEPESRRTFMRARTAMLEALVTASGRALLWRDDRSTRLRYLRLLERMTDDGYWLTNPAGRLPIYLAALLDEDRPLDETTRVRARGLLGR